VWFDRLTAGSFFEKLRLLSTFADLSGRCGRENTREHLKMAVSLEFWHFQPAA
jgi:hypothetical protein